MEPYWALPVILWWLFASLYRLMLTAPRPRRRLPTPPYRIEEDNVVYFNPQTPNT